MRKMMEMHRAFFLEGRTKTYSFRKKQLQNLKKMLQYYEEDIYDALQKDLNKSKQEVLTTELGILYTEINYAIRHLKSWMQEKKVPAPFTHKGTKNVIKSEPYGTVLVIAPWNYPLQLAIAPVIGAIAAGNTVVLKPSEFAAHTSSTIKNMVENTFSSDFFTVVEGAKDVSEALLKERFDYIFFTGSTNVGKIIMEKASVYLTPITLELGGKSPAIVDQNVQLALTAKRLAWGKFTNAGQTCVAPDYIYVHERIYKKFIHFLKKEIIHLYGKNPLINNDYVRMIHSNHFERLVNFMQDGDIIYGGEYNRQTLTIAPTILINVSWDSPIMKEEIFGPLLPILPYKHLDSLIKTLQQKEKPLALYYFGNSKKNEQKILDSLSFGGGCINDTLYHLANPHLPFGGIGHSGMGAYHGKYSFETFSHKKSILKQSTKVDFPVRYPGSKLAFGLAKKILK